MTLEHKTKAINSSATVTICNDVGIGVVRGRDDYLIQYYLKELDKTYEVYLQVIEGSELILEAKWTNVKALHLIVNQINSVIASYM